MPRKATPITLSQEERATLERWVRGRKTEQRLAERARIVLLAGAGRRSDEIAAHLGTSPVRVSKWRIRFARERLAALRDRPRSGAPPRYGEATRQRILAQLDQPPPSGHATWTGALLAAALGDVSKHQVWRVLRRHQISLRRRREFLDFMNRLVALYKGRELHVVLDNLNTHKPQRERWLQRHRNVHFHYTPTRASWLNQVEIWFSILSRRALQGASFTSPRQVRQAIDRFIEAYNQDAHPFEWTKSTVHPRGLINNYSDLRN